MTAEEQSACKDEITLAFSAEKLDKKDFFGKSDPFLDFSRVSEGGQFSVVHRTEVIKKSLNPRWKSFTVPVRVLCAGDLFRFVLLWLMLHTVDYRTIKIQCVDWNRDGSEDLIGECSTTVDELRTAEAHPVQWQVGWRFEISVAPVPSLRV